MGARRQQPVRTVSNNSNMYVSTGDRENVYVCTRNNSGIFCIQILFRKIRLNFTLIFRRF
jgi:hypothetical protein